MGNLKVTVDTSNPFKGVEDAAKKSKSRALKRALPFAQKRIVQTLKETYAVQTKAVKSAMSVHKDDDGAAILIAGPPLGIDKYSVKPKHDTTGNLRRPVKVSVRKDTARTVDKGFVWQGHVFRRIGDARLPVEKVTGPAVAQLIDDPETLENISKETQDYYEQRLQHELDHELDRNGNK